MHAKIIRIYKHRRICLYRNLPDEIYHFGLATVLLSFLISELQEPSSLGLDPRIDFQGSGHCFRNLLFRTNISGLGAILLSCLVSKLQKPSSWDSNPGQFFGAAFVPAIFSLKQTSLVLAPFFYRA
jgi:hypothetical protein